MDFWLVVFACGIVVVGVLLSRTLSRSLARQSDIDLMAAETAVPPRVVLIAFSVAVAVLAAASLVYLWSWLLAHTETMLFGAWLFAFMVAGMFVQVIAENRKQDTALFNVTAGQLIFPLLYSVVVFYPIWILASKADSAFFSLYAAFLNGYFWRTIVSTAKPQTP